MVRQAHTYLVGAVSGATLIAIAIAAFVVLVSAQVFSAWPIAGLSGGGESAAVSEGHPAGGAGTAVTTAATQPASPAAGPRQGSTGAGKRTAGDGAVATSDGGAVQGGPGAGPTGGGAGSEGPAGSASP